MSHIANSVIFVASWLCTCCKWKPWKVWKCRLFIMHTHTVCACIPAHVKGLIKCAACVCVFIWVLSWWRRGPSGDQQPGKTSGLHQAQRPRAGWQMVERSLHNSKSPLPPTSATWTYTHAHRDMHLYQRSDWNSFVSYMCLGRRLWWMIACLEYMKWISLCLCLCVVFGFTYSNSYSTILRKSWYFSLKTFVAFSHTNWFHMNAL